MTISHPDPTLETLLHHHPNLTVDPQHGLIMGKVALHDIAQAVGTPCWVMDAGTLRHRAQAMQKAFHETALSVDCHFAVKSQDHLACLALLAQEGWGADVVSGGELKRALAAGIPAHRIVFSGVGKTDDELELAITHNIAQVNIESQEELFRLNTLACRMKRRVKAALRVNPDIDAKTHSKITTGRAEDKFGIPYQDIPALYHTAQHDLSGVDLLGLAVHLGSQITTDEPLRKGYEHLANMVTTLRRQGLTVDEIDCGGGLGISYRDETAPPPAMLARVMADIFGDMNVHLRIEPGRWLAAPAGVLLTRVIDTKQGSHKFVIIDAGMNDLVRPAMYDSWHGILPVTSSKLSLPTEIVDVVGPICESSDTFARQRALPPLERHDILALLDTGAYGSVMSSTYNARAYAPQVMIHEGEWDIIRPRQTVEELMAYEHMPTWLIQDAT